MDMQRLWLETDLKPKTSAERDRKEQKSRQGEPNTWRFFLVEKVQKDAEISKTIFRRRSRRKGIFAVWKSPQISFQTIFEKMMNCFKYSHNSNQPRTIAAYCRTISSVTLYNDGNGEQFAMRHDIPPRPAFHLLRLALFAIVNIGPQAPKTARKSILNRFSCNYAAKGKNRLKRQIAALKRKL